MQLRRRSAQKPNYAIAQISPFSDDEVVEETNVGKEDVAGSVLGDSDEEESLYSAKSEAESSSSSEEEEIIASSSSSDDDGDNDNEIEKSDCEAHKVLSGNGSCARVKKTKSLIKATKPSIKSDTKRKSRNRQDFIPVAVSSVDGLPAREREFDLKFVGSVSVGEMFDDTAPLAPVDMTDHLAPTPLSTPPRPVPSENLKSVAVGSSEMFGKEEYHRLRHWLNLAVSTKICIEKNDNTLEPVPSHAKRKRGRPPKNASSSALIQEPSPRRGSGLIIPIERQTILIIESNAEGRYRCPVPGCDRDFKVLPSFKYHHPKHRHDILTTLKACFVLPDQQENNEQSSADSNPSDFPSTWHEFELVLSRAAKYMLNQDIPALETETTAFQWSGPSPSRGKCSFLFAQLFPGSCSSADCQTNTKNRRSSTSAGPVAKIVADLPSYAPPLIPFSAISLPTAQIICSECLPLKSMMLENDLVESYLPSYPFLFEYVEISQRVKRLIPTLTSISLTDNSTQYLAVAGCRDNHQHSLIGIRLHGKGSIQLWSVPCLTEDVTYSVSLDEQPKLSSILLYDDYGSVIDMKWVPKSYAPSINRLGLLSVTFSDGHFRIFSIPLVSQEISKDYAVVRLTPIFDETYGDGAFISIAWTEWQDIFFAAVGTESGGIAIWQLISNRTSSKLVLVSFTPGHSACVRSLAFFARSESTSSESLFVLSAAFDGTVIAHHVFDPIQQYVIQATRGYILDCAIFPDHSGCIFSGSDRVVRYVANDASDAESWARWLPVSQAHYVPSRPSEETHDSTLSWTVQGCGESVPCLSVSPWHRFLAYGTETGSLVVTNLERSLRSYGGSQEAANRKKRGAVQPISVPLFQVHSVTLASSEALQENNITTSEVDVIDKDRIGPDGFLSMVFDESPAAVEETVPRYHPKTSSVEPCPGTTHATSVEWHPSRSTWLACGLRSGIVRIECCVRDNDYRYRRRGRRPVGKVEKKKNGALDDCE